MKILLIAVGGALGAVSRYLVSKFFNATFSFSFVPWGTVVVNVIGAFLLSLMMFSHLEKVELSQSFLLFFGTGFLGAFTTFSTFSYETLSLIRVEPLRGITYFFANIVFGFAAAFFGMVFGRGKII